MATIRLYHDTGFDLVNMPAASSVLESAAQAYNDYTIDIIQIYNLGAVKLPLKEADVIDADYCRVSSGGNSCYYYVRSYQMAALDVAWIELVMDPLLTAGGMPNVTVLTGNASRLPYRQAQKTADNMVIDELAVLTRQPKFTSKGIGNAGLQIYTYAALVASTVDLAGFDASSNDLYEVDENGVVKAKNVPPTITDDMLATIEVYYPTGLGSPLTVKTYGYALYNYNDPKIQAAIQTLRLMGMDSSIVGAYLLPLSYSGVIYKGTGQVDRLTMIFSSLREGVPNVFKGAPAAVYGDPDIDAPEEWDVFLQHFADYKIGLIAVGTGSSIECAGQSAGSKVYTMVDPRMDGCPYYLLPMAKQSGIGGDVESEIGDAVDSWNACLSMRSVAGSQWDRIPVITSMGAGALKSGLNIAKRNDTVDRVAKQAREWGFIDEGVNLGMSVASGNNTQSMPRWKEILGSTAALTVGGLSYLAGQAGLDSLADNMGASATEMLTATNPLEREKALRDMQNEAGWQAWVGDTYYVAPDVKGAIAEGMVQFVGNGCELYCIAPCATDMAKYDTCVALNGIAVNQPVNNLSLSRRNGPPCDYLRIAGAAVRTSGNVPAAVRDSLVTALGSGIRVWWTRPEAVAQYTSYGGE